MAPVNRKRPLSPSLQKSSNSFDEEMSDEDHDVSCPDNRECPFQVERLRQVADDSTLNSENTKNVYIVRPAALWDSMTRYWAFNVNGKHFSTHENIYVTRSRRIYDEPENGQPAAPCRFERETWAARILEIRALDNTHVYLRLFWFYSPDDLPQGRKLYHGDEELIASNDMDIVDACRIVGHAEISHWKETDSDDLPDYGSFYWRQTYDVTTGKLSDLETHCICAEPHDPEVPLIRCTNPSCGLRMHQGCIIANHLVTLHEDAAAAPTPTTITTTTTPTPTTTSSKRRARNPPAPHAPRAPRRRTSLHDFNVRIVDLDDPHNHDGHVAPPRMRVEDCRRSKPLVWRREIVCLDCERGLG